MPSIIPNNDVTELYDATFGVIGFGFGSPVAVGSNQIQRWLLKKRDNDNDWWPNRTQVLRTATTAPWDTITTETAFINQVTATFNSSTDLYVKINAQPALNDASGKIVRPPPNPSHLGPTTGTYPVFQGDVGLTQIRRGDGTSGVLGFVYTLSFAGDPSISTEYWGLYSTYALAKLPTLQKLTAGEDVPDIMDGKPWTTHATLVVAACRYFSTLPTGQM